MHVLKIGIEGANAFCFIKTIGGVGIHPAEVGKTHNQTARVSLTESQFLRFCLKVSKIDTVVVVEVKRAVIRDCTGEITVINLNYRSPIRQIHTWTNYICPIH